MGARKNEMEAQRVRAPYCESLFTEAPETGSASPGPPLPQRFAA